MHKLIILRKLNSMKLHFLLILSFLLSSFVIFAQIPAVTSTGEQVFLYEDGTWSYAEDSNSEIIPIDENPAEFFKPSDASFKVSSKRVGVGVWINPKLWEFTKSATNEDAEFQFGRRNEDCYAMLITERIEIPLSTLMDIAVTNARAVAPDIKVVKKEYRNVNGVRLLYMQMNGTTQGIKFSYMGYYYSSAEGTIQLVAYTSQDLLGKYKNMMEELLNGFALN